MKVGPKSSLRPFLHRALQLCAAAISIGGIMWVFFHTAR